MAQAQEMPGAFSADQYTGKTSKAWRQLTNGSWEDIYHPGHVLTDQQAQQLSSQNHGPYAVGQGGFFQSLLKDVSPFLSFIPGVGGLASAAANAAQQSGIFGSPGGGTGITNGGPNGGAVGDPSAADAAANNDAAFANLARQNLLNLANTNAQQYQNALPQEQQIQNYFKQRAEGTLPANTDANVLNSPSFVYARQVAQEDAQRQATNQQHALQNGMIGRGLQGSSALAGGLAAIQGANDKAYSDFTRQQLINAPSYLGQQYANYQNSLSPNLAAGGAAAGQFGQAANLGYQGQALNTGQSNLLHQLQSESAAGGSSNPFGNFANIFGAGGNNPNIPAGTSASDAVNSGTASPAPDTLATNPNLDSSSPYDPFSSLNTMGDAGGGVLHQGQPMLVGEKGPETFVGSNGKPHMISVPHGLFSSMMQHIMDEVKNLPHRATGGTTPVGHPYVVGEHGPEIFVPQQNGYIIPNKPQDLNPAGWMEQGANGPQLDPVYMHLKNKYSGKGAQ